MAGKRIVILGAGGAARAISVECALAGAVQLTIINRTEAKGRELAELIARKPAVPQNLCTGQRGKIPSCDILVNATNIGLYPDESLPDIDYESIDKTW